VYSMEPELILIVEDDPQLAQALDNELRKSYRTRVVDTGGDAVFIAETEAVDLILLDLNLPDMDGIEVAEQLADNEADILMLTARGDLHSRVSGLYSGASDYLAKPFDMQELLARVYAILRNRSRPDLITVGELTFSNKNRECTVSGRPVDLSAQEFRLLSLLLANQGRIFSKSTIESRLYPHSVPDSNIVEVLVSRLRNKLSTAGAKELIRTIRGLGYVVRQ
jgi:two-component system response regulator QseB